MQRIFWRVGVIQCAHAVRLNIKRCTNWDLRRTLRYVRQRRLEIYKEKYRKIDLLERIGWSVCPQSNWRWNIWNSWQHCRFHSHAATK